MICIIQRLSVKEALVLGDERSISFPKPRSESRAPRHLSRDRRIGDEQKKMQGRRTSIKGAKTERGNSRPTQPRGVPSMPLDRKWSVRRPPTRCCRTTDRRAGGWAGSPCLRSDPRRADAIWEICRHPKASSSTSPRRGSADVRFYDP